MILNPLSVEPVEVTYKLQAIVTGLDDYGNPLLSSDEGSFYAIIAPARIPTSVLSSLSPQLANELPSSAHLIKVRTEDLPDELINLPRVEIEFESPRGKQKAVIFPDKFENPNTPFVRGLGQSVYGFVLAQTNVAD